jgi:hypothetical protein
MCRGLLLCPLFVLMPCSLALVQVSQGSGAHLQDETSNEGLVVDVDSPAAPQSKY